MFKSKYFATIYGEYDTLATLTFPTSLGLSDADADVGLIRVGKPVTFANNSLDTMKYGDNDSFLGFLGKDISLEGPLGVQSYYDINALGLIDIPTKRGSKVEVIIPRIGFLFEVEDAGTDKVEKMLITSGTGAIANNTALHTELSLTDKGCWKLAADGDMVYAHLYQANVAPKIENNVRIRARICSPYRKVVVV